MIKQKDFQVLDADNTFILMVSLKNCKQHLLLMMYSGLKAILNSIQTKNKSKSFKLKVKSKRWDLEKKNSKYKLKI